MKVAAASRREVGRIAAIERRDLRRAGDDERAANVVPANNANDGNVGR
jgi:hypothetical protein